MKVSVIIPVYNQEKLLKRAVDSIPLDEDLEVIIVNDGSTDNTRQVIESLIKHPKIRGYDMLVNEGVANARNFGIEVAKGEYLLMLDADDWLFKDNFKKCLSLLNGTDMVYFNLEINNGSLMRVTNNSKRGYCGATKFIRADFLGSTRYPKDMRTGEDWYLNEELLEKEPTEIFTDLTVKHYDFPREGSLYDNLVKQRGKK